MNREIVKILRKNNVIQKRDMSRTLFVLSWLLGAGVVLTSILTTPKITQLGMVIPVVSDSTYNFLIFFISTFTVNYLGRKATDAWHNKSIVGLTSGGNVAMNNMPTTPSPYGTNYGSMMPGMSNMSGIPGMPGMSSVPGMSNYSSQYYNPMNPMQSSQMPQQQAPTLPNGNKANLQQSMPVIINVNESKQNQPPTQDPASQASVGLSNVHNLHSTMNS